MHASCHVCRAWQPLAPPCSAKARWTCLSYRPVSWGCVPSKLSTMPTQRRMPFALRRSGPAKTRRPIAMQASWSYESVLRCCFQRACLLLKHFTIPCVAVIESNMKWQGARVLSSKEVPVAGWKPGMLDVGETPGTHVTWSTLVTFNSSINVLDLAVNSQSGDLFGLVAYSSSDAQVRCIHISAWHLHVFTLWIHTEPNA